MRSLFLAFLLSIAPLGAAAASFDVTATSFTGDPLEVEITFDDQGAGAGEILVTATVSGTGDIRGLFLDISDDSLLSGLTVSGADVTGVDTSGSVINLGRGANLNGGGTPCPCDIGIEFGSPGIGKDDLDSVEFVLGHSTESLELALFDGEYLGVRVTSVGDEYGREGSSKLIGVAVPEPSTLALLPAVWLLARRRRSVR